LRLLDASLPLEALETFPRGRDGGSTLFRERLLADLMSGARELRSVVSSDVVAAQRDVHSLSLRQLLRLRVRHLDFVPSGCGSDTVTGVGGAHEAFLSAVDNRMFRLLGETVAGPFATQLDVDMHRLGREAVLLVAAASAVTVSSWWCWWIMGELRVFLHVGNLSSCGASGPIVIDSFPEGVAGVLEVTDYSKADRHEPTGTLRWFDWRVDLVACESALSDGPNGGESSPVASTMGSRGENVGRTKWRGFLGAAASGPLDSESDGDIAVMKQDSGGSAGVASSPMGLSVEVLRGTRNSLRKVGGKPPWEMQEP